MAMLRNDPAPLGKVLLLPGDGIGPEVMAEVRRVMDWFAKRQGISFETDEALVGGASYDRHGTPLTDAVMAWAQAADAVLFGAVGGPRYDDLPFEHKPERGLAPQEGLGLFANLRPAKVFDALVDSSSLKPELVKGLDIMILRELTGGIYFGEPRGIETLPDGQRRGVNTQVYTTNEIVRIARVGFELAQKRNRRVLGREGERDGIRRAVARGGAEAARRRVSGRRAVAHVRRQLRDAAGAPAQAVRRHRQRQPVRRPARTARRCSPARSACCRRPRSARPGRTASARRCTSRCTAARRTSPARAGGRTDRHAAELLHDAPLLVRSGAAADLLDEAIGGVLATGLRTADIMQDGMARSVDLGHGRIDRARAGQGRMTIRRDRLYWTPDRLCKGQTSS